MCRVQVSVVLIMKRMISIFYFGCSDSQQVWNESGLRDVIVPRLHVYNNVKDVIFDLCRAES
jgi:hypothetical protein